MENRVRVLKEMAANSLYVVDERAVANAILARAAVHRAIAAPELRTTRPDRGPVRSFRRTRSARSFRLTQGPPGMAHHHH